MDEEITNLAEVDIDADWDEAEPSETDDWDGAEATESKEPEADGEADQPATEAEDAQTTGTASESDKAATEPENKPDTDQFTLKYLGEEVTKTKDEVIALAQKGMDYERVHSKYEELKPLKDELATLKAEREKDEDDLSFLDELAKEQRVTRSELIDRARASIIAEREGKDVAVVLEKVKLDREKRAIAKEKAAMEAAKTAKNAEADAETKAKAKRDADVKEFVEAYPTVDPKTIPKEVWDDVKQGKSLLAAYVKHENAKLKAELDAEKAKLEAEKKNAENKSKSTGSRATVGKKKDMDSIDASWYDGT
jgi:hypothetical protein